jgi:hypothetical protein
MNKTKKEKEHVSVAIEAETEAETKVDEDMILEPRWTAEYEVENDDIFLDSLVSFGKFPFQKAEGDRLLSLSREIKEYGLLNPIAVRPHPSIEGKYEIICGHNRVEAVRLLGRKIISAKVYRGLSEEQVEGMFFGDNLTQQNFNDWNYSQKIKAVRHIDKLIKENSEQGKRTDLENKEKDSSGDETSTHDGQKSKGRSKGRGKSTRGRMTKSYGIGESTLGNYKSIIKLDDSVVDYLVELMDGQDGDSNTKRMSFAVAYRISQLKPSEINALLDYLKENRDVKFKGKMYTKNFEILSKSSVANKDKELSIREMLEVINADTE